MNTNTRLLGLLSSWGILLLMIIVTITMFYPLFIHNRVWQPAITTYYKIDPPRDFVENLSYYAHFLTSPLLLVLFACFHDQARHSHKIYSRLAISFMIIAVAFRFLSMIWQPPLQHFNIHACDSDCLLYEFYKILNHLISSVFLISITLLTGLAELFLVPVLSYKNKAEKNLKIVLFVSGILMILSVVPFEITDFFNNGLILVLGQIFIIVVMIYCIKFFRHLNIKDYEE